MDYASRRWALNGWRPVLLLAIGLTVLKELALHSLAWLFGWNCFWIRFGYASADSDAIVAIAPVIPVAHSIAPSVGCLRVGWLLPVVFIGISLISGATFQHAERRRLLAMWLIVPMALALGFLRTLGVVAYNHAAWPFSYYGLDVPFPVDIMYDFAFVGIFLIDVGFLLWAIALGRRITRGWGAAG